MRTMKELLDAKDNRGADTLVAVDFDVHLGAYLDVYPDVRLEK